MTNSTEAVDHSGKSEKQAVGVAMRHMRNKNPVAFDEFRKDCESKGIAMTDELLRLAKTSLERRSSILPPDIELRNETERSEKDRTDIFLQLNDRLRAEMIQHSTDVQQLNASVISKDTTIAEQRRVIEELMSFMTPPQIEKYVHLEQDRESRFYPSQPEPEMPSPSFAGPPRAPPLPPEIPLDETGQIDWRRYRLPSERAGSEKEK